MQTPFDPKHPPAAPAPEVVPKIHRVEVYWHAVTYKTVMIYVLIVFGLLLAGSYVAAPDWYASGLRKVTSAITPEGSDTPPLQQTQAKFVNLDGKVQVKKVNSVQWVEADYHTALDKGDLIQTASDGAARITFADGTEYTVKSDTLVTVEENDVTRDHSTTAVRINTGTVDLATGSSPDSQASVSVEDATAHVQQNSRATIKNDPQKNEHEIVVNTGSAQVQRGQEKIEALFCIRRSNDNLVDIPFLLTSHLLRRPGNFSATRPDQAPSSAIRLLMPHGRPQPPPGERLRRFESRFR